MIKLKKIATQPWDFTPYVSPQIVLVGRAARTLA